MRQEMKYTQNKHLHYFSLRANQNIIFWGEDDLSESAH